MDVVALGENSLDFVAVAADDDAARQAAKRSLAQFRLQPGGQMATAAVACARLGVRTRYVGAFGADEWGARARAPLDAEGVEVVDLAPAGVPGRVAVILVDGSGDRVVHEYRDSRLRIDPDAVTSDLVADARVLLVDATHPSAAIRAVAHARAARTISIVDVDRASHQTDALLAAVDVVVLPEIFAHAWTGAIDPRDALRRAAARCPQAALVAITRGPHGVLACAGDELVSVPAFHVDAVDTTGAGDAFRAGLAVALLASGPSASLEDVLRFASAVAALNCRAVGAQGGLPVIDDVRRCLDGPLR